MAYHIVFNRPVDLASARTGAAAGEVPRHSMALLADRLGARVHDGSDLQPDARDRLIAKATRTRPLWWAIARALRREAAPGDVIYCTGEDIGLPVALLCGRRCRVAMMAHYVDRLKGKVALAAFGARRFASLFLAVSRPQVDFIRRFLKLGDDRVSFVWDQTDSAFFSPGAQRPDKARPLVMSLGLEQRDYTTLAQATADLPIDVSISGFSADTRVLDRAFPQTMPANMSRRFYPWPELRQLYRDADIVVVSLFPNNYAAGVQALMEGLTSGRPVIVSATVGLAGYLDAPGVRTIPPGDVDALRAAIEALLAAPPTAADAATAVEVARGRHRVENYVESIATALERLDRRG